MDAERSQDPHWDLVVEIAAMLWVDGSYGTELDTVPAQRLVDVQWAARQAGRVLGGRATVRLRRPRDVADRRVAVAVS